MELAKLALDAGSLYGRMETRLGRSLSASERGELRHVVQEVMR